LQLSLGIEAGQVLQRINGDILIDGTLNSFVGLLNPWVFKSLFSRWSLVLVEGKKFRDEVFALVRDSFPGWVIEVELSELNLLHNFLVGGTIEWWDTRKNNVGDDTNGPNIAFSTI